MEQYITAYDHDQLGLSTIHLAVVSPGTRPVTDDWIPAYRDMIGEATVVWVRSAKVDADLWIKDSKGERKAKRWS